MTDSVQAQLEAVLRGIEERTPHAKSCAQGNAGRVTEFISTPSCQCWKERGARVRAEQARTVERMVEAFARDWHVERGNSMTRDERWAAALRAGEEHQ